MEGQKYIRLGVQIWLFIVYAVGFFGLSNPHLRPEFVGLSVYHLLLNFFVVLVFHKKYCLPFILSIISIIFIGMVSEIIGTKTGYLFGSYYYSNLLGAKILGVPIIIGINWFSLLYGIHQILKFLPKLGLISKFICAGLLMVIIDLFLEPFAIQSGFWFWEGGRIPLFNYITWFFVSLLMYFIIQKTDSSKPNTMAIYVLILEFVFISLIYL